MSKRILYFIFIIFLLADAGYSFVQHYRSPLDGDMAGGIVPASDVKQILESPLGLKVFTEKINYPNPNRFFSHYAFYEYFNVVPLFIQKFTDPVNSVYLSCAIAKIVTQLGLIIILAMGVSGTTKMLKFEFLLAATLITPLFQTNGYRGYMGIIDSSTTYTFFYALPFLMLLIYFFSFMLRIHNRQVTPIHWAVKCLWIPFALVISLSGPLNPGIALILSSLIIIHHLRLSYFQYSERGVFRKAKKAIQEIPVDYWHMLVPLCFFSIYSLLLGRYNSISISNQISLIELYSKLPKGVFLQFTQMLGFPILFVTIAINSVLINRINTPEGKKILSVFKWIGWFAFIYILLLPLGGYRTYRPNILRYDTIIPITISLMFIFSLSSLYLLKQMSTKQLFWYIPIIGLVLFIFINSDTPKFDKNENERLALHTISNSSDTVVKLNCSPLSWGKIQRPEESELNAELLLIWGITKDKKLYYQE